MYTHRFVSTAERTNHLFWCSNAFNVLHAHIRCYIFQQHFRWATTLIHHIISRWNIYTTNYEYIKEFSKFNCWLGNFVSHPKCYINTLKTNNSPDLPELCMITHYNSTVFFPTILSNWLVLSWRVNKLSIQNRCSFNGFITLFRATFELYYKNCSSFFILTPNKCRATALEQIFTQ